MDLSQLLLEEENHSIEFKAVATRSIAKEVAAFSSSRGGLVVVGIRDGDHAVVGIGESFEVARQKVQSWIHEFVRPAPDYSIGRIEEAGGDVMVVRVEAGREAAYAFDERFYYRNNEQSQPIPASELTRRFADARVSKGLAELANSLERSHPKLHTAAGIAGQGDLATMTYRGLLDRLIADLRAHFVER